MGRGLGIFPARPKTPFVPGGATTRDKRAFCPGWWIHSGQKGGPLYMSLNLRLPPTLAHFPDLRRAAVVSHRASCSAVVSHCASCSAAFPERRPSSAASTPRPPWTTTPPGRSLVRRRPRPPCHLVFAASGHPFPTARIDCHST